MKKKIAVLMIFAFIFLSAQSIASLAEKISADDDAYLGDENAEITIIEFVDYQCLFCRRFYTQTFPQLVQNYVNTNEVKFVVRDFPLRFHPSAQVSSEATECAKEQGKFWDMHNKIFDEQNEQGQETIQFTKEDVKNWAAEIGLDTTRFNECLDSNRYKTEVEKDSKDGTVYGVQGTPHFFITKGGLTKEIVGSQYYSEFEKVINELKISDEDEPESNEYTFTVENKVFKLKIVKESEEGPMFVITGTDGFLSKAYVKDKTNNIFKAEWYYGTKSYNIVIDIERERLTVEPVGWVTEPQLPTYPIPQEEDDKPTCSGCEYDNQCFSVGLRIADIEGSSYCDKDGNIKLKKADDEQCQNDFECVSNSCGNGICQNFNERIEGIEEELREQRSILQRILDFFSRLFGSE